MADSNKLSAILEVKDGFSATIKKASTGFKKIQEEAKKTGDAVLKTASNFGTLKTQMKSPFRSTITLKDKATSTIKKVQSSLNAYKNKSYTAYLKVKEIAAPITPIAQRTKGMISSMTMGVPAQMMAGAGITMGVYNAIKTYKDFESQMKSVQAISGATNEQFEILSRSALEMGAKTKFTATESGKALEYMGMAGWNTNQMIAGLPGVMNLAAASGEDLAQVSDIVTDTLTAFGEKASDASRFADVLAQASRKSNTNVGMMGLSFQYVAPLAGALKYSIEDVAVALGAMANAGIKADKAGTSLRGLLTRMAAPNKRSKKAMQALGVSLTDSTGNMKALNVVLGEMREGFKKLNPEQKAMYASWLAGQEGMSGLLAIMNTSQSEFDSLTKSIKNSKGAAADMANIKMDNLEGDLKILSSTWENFVITLMRSKDGFGLRGLVQGLTEVIKSMKELGADGKEHFTIWGGLKSLVSQLTNKFMAMDGVGSVLAGGALAVGGFKLYKIFSKLFGVVSSVGKATKGIKLPKIPVKALGKLATPLAVATGIYEIATAKKGERAKTVGNVAGGLAGAFAGGKVGAIAGGAIGSIIPGIGNAIGAAIGGIVGSIGGYIAGSGIGEKLATLIPWEKIKNAGIETINHTIGMVSLIVKGMYSVVAPIVDWFNANVWQPIKETGIGMWNRLVNSASAFFGGICAIFSPLATWFDSVVWQPIATSASNAWNSITSWATDAWNSIKSTWQGAVDWFNSNVWQPLSKAFSKADAEGASITGLKVEHHATGTSYFGGGLTEINERGGEIIDLPTGSRIYPHATTEKMIKQELNTPNSSGANVTITGNQFIVREDADIDKIAYKIAQLFGQAKDNYGGAY